MKVYLKILTTFLAMACCMPMACKKENPQAGKINELKPPVTIEPESKMIPVQMGTGSSKITFSYTADYSLSKVVYGDGTSSKLEYNAAGQPLLFIHYDGDEIISYVQFKLDNSGRVIKGSRYKTVANADIYVEMFTISYSIDSQVYEISYYTPKQVLTHTEKRVYAANGNLVREENSNGLLTADNLYDAKNGLFKNAGYGWLFALEEQNRLFLCGPNNISSCSYPAKPVNNQTFSYTYNSTQYPETVKATVNGVTLNYKVAYRSLE